MPDNGTRARYHYGLRINIHNMDTQQIEEIIEAHPKSEIFSIKKPLPSENVQVTWTIDISTPSSSDENTLRSHLLAIADLGQKIAERSGTPRSRIMQLFSTTKS